MKLNLGNLTRSKPNKQLCKHTFYTSMKIELNKHAKITTSTC